jgi:ArsR family transcriptional regulator
VTQLLKLGPDHGVDAERLAALRAERLAASTAYFDAQADDWDRLRELHVADSEVEAAVVSLLCTLPLGRLVDVGTGTGRMLELLAARSDSALGIDRSVDMLRAARAKLDTLDLPHCSLRHGDMHALPSLEQAADTVVMHQVLHFAEKPSLAIQEAARILAPGGRLLIADFAPHDREELRRDHAHARLGFADDVVRTWLRRAGLQLGETRQLEGPLTVTIWLAGKPQRRDRKAA